MSPQVEETSAEKKETKDQNSGNQEQDWEAKVDDELLGGSKKSKEKVPAAPADYVAEIANV